MINKQLTPFQEYKEQQKKEAWEINTDHYIQQLQDNMFYMTKKQQNLPSSYKRLNSQRKEILQKQRDYQQVTNQQQYNHNKSQQGVHQVIQMQQEQRDSNKDLSQIQKRPKTAFASSSLKEPSNFSAHQTTKFKKGPLTDNSSNPFDIIKKHTPQISNKILELIYLNSGFPQSNKSSYSYLNKYFYQQGLKNNQFIEDDHFPINNQFNQIHNSINNIGSSVSKFNINTPTISEKRFYDVHNQIINLEDYLQKVKLKQQQNQTNQRQQSDPLQLKLQGTNLVPTYKNQKANKNQEIIQRLNFCVQSYFNETDEELQKDKNKNSKSFISNEFSQTIINLNQPTLSQQHLNQNQSRQILQNPQHVISSKFKQQSQTNQNSKDDVDDDIPEYNDPSLIDEHINQNKNIEQTNQSKLQNKSQKKIFIYKKSNTEKLDKSANSLEQEKLKRLKSRLSASKLVRPQSSRAVSKIKLLKKGQHLNSNLKLEIQEQDQQYKVTQQATDGNCSNPQNKQQNSSPLNIKDGNQYEYKDLVQEDGNYESEEECSLSEESFNQEFLQTIEQDLAKDGEEDIKQEFDEEDYQKNPHAHKKFNFYQSKRPILLLESIYEGRAPTVLFQYPPWCGMKRDLGRSILVYEEDRKAYDLKYKMGSSTHPFLCVTSAFEYAGFQQTQNEGDEWNGFWGRGIIEGLKKMNKFQKSNHFPGCWNLGRKDNLWIRVSRMKRKFPEDYSFVPRTFLLSCEWDRFINTMEDEGKKSMWILKPVASSCGRGIKLFTTKKKIRKKNHYLASEYISKPHLINGYKYDLRVYVLITSYDPLRIYFYDDGLTRFATEKYDTKKQNLKHRFIHLTNYSVNKMSDKFVKNQNSNIDNQGSKWSLQALFKKYEELNIDYKVLFSKIHDIIIKTCIAVEPFMLNSINKTQDHRNNCFELYGFDILVDENINPWLLECNVCPSLSSTSPLDKKIKTSLLCDILNLIGFVPYDKKKFNKQNKKTITKQSIKEQIEEKQPLHSKNIKEIMDLNESNCLKKLNEDDWQILFETDEENHRTGRFNRIFPPSDPQKIDYYSQFFEYQRYNNLIVWQAIKSPSNFLEKICKKISDVNV